MKRCGITKQKILLSLNCCIMVPCMAQTTTNKFELAVEQIYQQYPHTRLTPEEPRIENEESLPYQAANKAIDLAACIYILARVAAAYHAVYKDAGRPESPGQANYARQCFITFLNRTGICSLYDGYLFTKFLTQVCTIGLKTVVCKSVAKFVLFCCKADLIDLVKAGAKRTRTIMRSKRRKH